MTDPSQAPLGFLLHDAARLLRKRFEQRARHLGLTRSQWQVLAYLSNNEGIHQGGLAELLDIEPITLVRLLDKLESIDLIERRPHATDRRVRLLHLTDKARPLLGSARKLGEVTRAEALQGVSPEDRETLIRVLGIVKSNLAEACERPAALQDIQRDAAENG